MKILLANWVYNWGSTGYIVRDLRNSYIDKGHEVFIASAVNFGNRVPEAYIFSNKLLLTLYGLLTKYLGFSKFSGSWLATFRFIQYVRRVNPDIVHVHILNNHALNMYYVLKFLGKNRYKTVITHHAEFYYTGCCGYSYDCDKWVNSKCLNCPSAKEVTGSLFFGSPHSHWMKMQKSFDYFDNTRLFFTAVSPWVKSRSLQSPFLKRFTCKVVLNGIDTNVFCLHKPSSPQAISRLEKSGLVDYCLHVTASFVPDDKSNIKGGYYLAELARLNPDIQFVVVSTSENITIDIPSNIVVWGKAQNQVELANLYSRAKVTILTSRRETFSMICAESLCCGTPVIGFRAGGPETISLPNYSSFCEQEDVESLSKLLKESLIRPYSRADISEEAVRVYAKDTMASRYIEVYGEFDN